MKMQRRLEKLEQQVGPPGCPACRLRRGHQVIVTTEELPDGTRLSSPDEPPPCSRCGEVPAFIVQVIIPVEAPSEEAFGPAPHGGASSR
jgi:hypothetical protein